jgi:hypothetical protein
MASLEIIAIVLTGLSITVSIVYYAMVLRNHNKTRQIQLFMQIYRDISSEESLVTWAELVNRKVEIEEYLQKYDSTVNTSHFGKRASFWYKYNTIGELLRLNMIDVDLLKRLNVDTNAIIMWESWEHIIKDNRKRENMPDIWAGFEFLYDEMKKYRRIKNYPDITYNP